jgi:hypothetical protein
VSEVSEAIAREYDVERLQCEADVIDFLRALETKGLIEVRDGT